MTRRDVRRLGVDELAIDLVGDEVELVLLHEIANLAHLLLGIEVTRGVVGVADEDGACLGRDLFLKLLHRRQLEAVLDMRLDGFDHRAAGDSECHIVGITRVGDDDLVARVQTTHIRKHDRLRTAGGDDDLVGREVDTVVGVVAHHLRAQGFETLRGRVGEYILLEVLDRLQGLRRRSYIRLTDVQMIDMNAGTLGIVRILRQLADWRFRH